MMKGLLEFVLVVAGLVAFLSLPGLWAAWDGPVLALIFASGFGAAVLYIALYFFSDMAKPAGPR